MAPNINTLPVETLEIIVSYLEDGDVLNLSTMCRALRARTTHRVFHTVRFSNDPRISDSALLAVKKHGVHVKVLRFVGYAGEEDDKPDTGDCAEGTCGLDESQSEPETDEWDSDCGPVRNRDRNTKGMCHNGDDEQKPRPVNRDILPPSALVLFEASTTLLPNLETFSINFNHDYDYDCSDEFDSPFGASMFKHVENWAMVEMREAKLTMCRLWANTYKALASNKTVPNLIIENWSPRGVSTFQTAEWRNYLNRLKSLDLRITAAQQAWGYTNGMQGYLKDISKMQGFFFEHLHAVETLKLSIWPQIPLGMHGRYFHIPLPLKPTGRMRRLKHLELENIFISADLVAFIVGYRTQLHTLTLRNAHSAAAEHGERAERPLPWAAFFDALIAAMDEHGPDKFVLSHFEFTSPAPLSETEAKTGKVRYRSERPAIRKVRDELEADTTGKRRLFGYGDLHEDHGFFVSDVKTNQASAVGGEDQAAYERFVARLEGRRGVGASFGAAEPERGREEEEMAWMATVKPARGSKAAKGSKAATKGHVAAATAAAAATASQPPEGSTGPAEPGAVVDVPVRTRRARKKEQDNAQQTEPRRSGRLAKMRGEGSSV